MNEINSNDFLIAKIDELEQELAKLREENEKLKRIIEENDLETHLIDWEKSAKEVLGE